MDIREKISKVYNIFLIAAIIMIAGLSVYTNLFHYCYKMNSDIASEAVLARLIWESGEWLPKSWYASTEIRFMQTPNLAAIFYGIVHNMNLAMGMACVVMTFGILASAYFFICQCPFQREQRLLFILLCLIIPNHFVVLELLYLFGSYYAIHVIFMFLTMGIYIQLLCGKHCGILKLGIPILMSFIMGIQGLRGILIFGAPILATEMLRQVYMIYNRTWQKKNLSAEGGWCVLLLSAGYAGTLLPVSIGQETSRNIRKGFTKLLQTVFPDIMRCLGFADVKKSAAAVYFVVLVISMAVLVYYVIQVFKKQCHEPAAVWTYFFLWISAFLSMLAVAFTTIDSSRRYYFMLLFAMVFGFTCFMKYAKEKSLILSIIGYGIILFLFAFQINAIYFPIIRSSEPAYSDEYEACRYLEENDYNIAYADFERANTMTALSGGSVRVAAVASLERMDICKWLTSTDWYVPNVPYESRTAYIVTEAGMEDFEKFYSLHREDIWLEMQFGNIYVYGSDYNFSCLE